MKDYTIQILSAVFGSVVSFLYGGLTSILTTLVALICIDFATGVIHAIAEQKLNSRTCSKGIAKKVYILALVAVGHLVDNTIGADICMSAVACFYIANESMSIIENAGKIGLPIPQKLIDVLEQLNGKENE